MYSLTVHIMYSPISCFLLRNVTFVSKIEFEGNSSIGSTSLLNFSNMAPKAVLLTSCMLTCGQIFQVFSLCIIFF